MFNLETRVIKFKDNMKIFAKTENCGIKFFMTDKTYMSPPI